MTSFAAQVLPVIAFLIAITVVAEVAQHAGVFDLAGRWAAQAGRGRVCLLWLSVVAIACLSTIVLSLDTTAVLFTPVVLAMAGQLGLPALPFAFVTVWLANTASLLLPVSNLSNLLARRYFGAQNYVALSWPPAVAAIAVTVVVAAVMFRRELRGRFEIPTQRLPAADPILRRIALTVCALLIPAFVSGVMPAIPAAAAAVVLVAALWWRDRDRVRDIAIPWRMVVVITVLLAAANVVGTHGGAAVMRAVAGTGTGLDDLLRLAGAGAVGANLINNLPAYLVLEPAATDSPVRLMALLIGTNVGPLITAWASLATVLWSQRCRRAGFRYSTASLAGRGVVVAVAAVIGATMTLWAVN